MIVVTGANGKLGRAIAEGLVERVPSDQVGVSVRDPEAAQVLRERGVRVRHGTFTNADSLRHSFEGASQLLFVSSGTTAGDTLSQHRLVIDAARACGVRRIVYTSHMGSSETSEFPPMRNHAATETLLRDSGIPFTSLRNGFYASSALLFMGNALETGELLAPADGPVSWTTHADLAQAAVNVLTEEGRFEGPTPALTASAALDMAGIAALASELAGRPIRGVTVSDEQHRAAMVARGLPEIVVEIGMGFFRASRAGEFAKVDPTLQQLLGRPPMAMRELMATRVSKAG